MPTPIQVLIVEDNLADAELLVRELRRADLAPEWRRVETESAYLGELGPKLELVLCDFALPQFSGLRALELLRERRLDLPFILVSGAIGEETAVEAMRRGATDYLLKDRLARLGSAVRHALEQGRMIREQGRILAALRASEERFRQVVENIREVFWMTDVARERMLYISPGFEAIWGRSCLSLYTTPGAWNEAIHPADRARVRQAALTKQALGGYDETFRILRPDGAQRWIRDRAFPIRDDTGAVHRIVGTAEDITERHQLEEQFRQAQKMEAIGTLAGGIAHDFNNILTAIGGYTELARLEIGDHPRSCEHLGAVLQGVNRASDLVRQILAFSRQQPLERRAVQLRPIVLETLKLLRAAIPATVEFETSLAANAPTVLADASQVHQVLMNLGTNAWHAMREHPGRLHVTLERWLVDAEEAGLQARLRPGVYARVSVRDTGCGMDAETLRRMFEPFFTTKGPGEGTGLGLAVVHGIMDTHDGAVTVSSHPGEGTVFRLYFPAYAGEAAKAVTADGPILRGQGERLLLVEDEVLLGQLGEKVLTALGYQATLATRPAEALALVRHDPQRFALVLTDQTMPGMTGLQLAAQLREIRPDLPIVLTTGYSLTLTPERLEAAGIRQLLLKPTTLQSLGAAVHAALHPQPPP